RGARRPDRLRPAGEAAPSGRHARRAAPAVPRLRTGQRSGSLTAALYGAPAGSARPARAGLPPAGLRKIGIEAGEHLLLHGVALERGGEEVALAQRAAEPAQLLELRVGFDPFRDDLVA